MTVSNQTDSHIAGHHLTNRTDTVWIELTSHCNLRCTYCHQSVPTFHAKDMDVGDFPRLVEHLQAMGVQEVVAQGRGETHFLEHWHHYVDQIQAAGIAVSGVMNLAKDYSEEEMLTLSRYRSITVSVDTVDRELTKRIRRSSDIRQILYNQTRIVATALAQGTKPPRIIWNCVTNDQVVMGLCEWISMGIALGVSEFNLALLSKFTHVPDALNVDHVTTLPDGPFLEALQIIETAVALGRAHGKVVTLHPGLTESLQRHREKIFSSQEGQRDSEPHADAGAGLDHIAVTQPGQTRNCLYPWSTAYIEADRSLRVCCISPIFKQLPESWDLAEILNGPELQGFRQAFLRGQLPAECAKCPTASITTPDDLLTKVEKYLSGKGSPRANPV
ncbi:MAG: radical SAM protein [Acidobacteria bacterium]|nr:radical SAM protein [Acidobacteriota bacterium]